MIYDLSSCPYSNRHGLYGGRGGDKDGIVFQGANWIVKYPKTTKGMSVPDDLKYTTSPLSEYIGSHIYQILGFDTHETILGYRNHKIVVALKDFLSDSERLAEIRSVKNAANKDLADVLRVELPSSETGDLVDLDVLFLHMDHNSVLSSVPGVKERFWEMVVVDALIDNNDRNNGNWGIILGEDRRLAPIYDNGNSFNNKTSESQIIKYLEESNEQIVTRAVGGRTSFVYNGKTLSVKRMLSLGVPELNSAIVRLTPLIRKMLPDIYQMIDDIPENYHGLTVIESARKYYYKLVLDIRHSYLFEPLYQSLVVKQELARKEQQSRNKSQQMDFEM